MDMASNSEGTLRILSRAKSALLNKEYYQAHQLYRTVYSRFLRQKDYAELKVVLRDATFVFLDKNQISEGSDLSTLLVKALIQSNERDFVHWNPILASMFEKIGSTHQGQRELFLDQCVKWASSVKGDRLLHEKIAKVYSKERNYIQARYHFMHSDDGVGCGNLLVEFQIVKGYKNETDLFITQAVLQYLCLKNRKAANECFITYTANHPRIKATELPYALPLLNFVWFLLQTVEKKLTTYAVLCELYKKSIERDPCYVQYLDKIGQIYFGIQPQPKRPAGIFGNIFENLFSLDDSDDNTQPPIQSTSRQSIENSELD